MRDAKQHGCIQHGTCARKSLGTTQEQEQEQLLTCDMLAQCVVKDDKATGKRIVAGTHWDFDSYGGTIKQKLGMPTQVCTLARPSQQSDSTVAA